MSLYHDAATVLTATVQDGSLKSRIYGNKLGLKSKPAHLYALISETAKYDVFLKEVIDNAGILVQEPKLTPILSLLLVHDHLFAKKGLAPPAGHPLRQAIERHKARLKAEFVKARLRRKCVSIDDLKRHVAAQIPTRLRSQPRWVRINTLKTTVEQELASTFRGYDICETLAELEERESTSKVLLRDVNIPDLVALPPGTDVTKTQAYKDGNLILQDKASCFPAYMLVGEADETTVRDCIDGCAAPGNKTSHLAALLAKENQPHHIVYACERDAKRSDILRVMMEKSGAKAVAVKPKTDFLTLDPHGPQYQKVTHLLLDPSCSGSGIVGREDVPSLALPNDSKAHKMNGADASKKRKREVEAGPLEESALGDSDHAEETREGVIDVERIRKLSNLQTRIVEHAFSFPAAVRITYSTCSVHAEENEAVVARVLTSSVARERGWHVLRREEQVSGLRIWPCRGMANLTSSSRDASQVLPALDEEEAEACIRCNPGDSEGTMGFFVCCFVRPDSDSVGEDGEAVADNNESWEGFSD